MLALTDWRGNQLRRSWIPLGSRRLVWQRIITKRIAEVIRFRRLSRRRGWDQRFATSWSLLRSLPMDLIHTCNTRHRGRVLKFIGVALQFRMLWDRGCGTRDTVWSRVSALWPPQMDVKRLRTTGLRTAGLGLLRLSSKLGNRTQRRRRVWPLTNSQRWQRCQQNGGASSNRPIEYRGCSLALLV
jgi:hypothetical protein